MYKVIISTVLVAVTSFYGGYSYKEGKVTQEKFTQEQIVSAAKDAYLQGLSDLSSNYKNDLKDVLSKNKHTKEIINNEKVKPIFVNVCASDEYVSLFNQQTEQYLKKLPSK